MPPFTTDLYYPGEVAAFCLGTGRSSRLYDRVVRQRVAKSASCHILPLTSGATIFLAIATGYPDTDVDDLEEAVTRELDEAATIAEAEVSRAVIGEETRTLRALQQVETRADLLSMYATHFGTAARLNEDLLRLRRVTPQEVREWAGGHVHPNNRAVVRYIPAAAS